MSILIGFLTFVLLLIALFLILLVLVQLPKKEAGVGMAFGAGMSEMLLGAGSGNVLTRVTKYTIGFFLGLSLLLAIMISHQSRSKGLGVTQALEQQARTAPVAPSTPTPPANAGLQPLTSSTTAITAPLVTTTQVVNPTPAPATPTPAPAAPAPAKPAGQ